jgi:hypothetical protein
VAPINDRRDHVPFDTRHFERLARAGRGASMQEAFEYIHRTRHWAGGESVSGEGATEAQTGRLRQIVADVVRDLGVRTLLDVPCGDFGWMRTVDLGGARYIGGDIVPALIAERQARDADDRHAFVVLDVAGDPLPAADLILCRDVFVHFSFADIRRTIDNIRRSGIPRLLTTTFPDHAVNEDITTGDWRLLNLERAPFHFPPPERLLNEGCTEGGGIYADKSLGLWDVARL